MFGAARCAFEAAARVREIATAAATAAAAAHATIEETGAVVSEAAVEPVSSATADTALAVSKASTADALDEESETDSEYDRYVEDRDDWCAQPWKATRSTGWKT
jgi:hypothetical protein